MKKSIILYSNVGTIMWLKFKRNILIKTDQNIFLSNEILKKLYFQKYIYIFIQTKKWSGCDLWK